MSCLHRVRVPHPRAARKGGSQDTHHYVPCGKCPACEANEIRKLQGAIVMETQHVEETLGPNHCFFVTLTYAPEHLPMHVPRAEPLGTVRGKDWQPHPNSKYAKEYLRSRSLADTHRAYLEDKGWSAGLIAQREAGTLGDGLATLEYRHPRDLVRRARKRGAKPRVAISGEYGDGKGARATIGNPHYHGIFMGVTFDEMHSMLKDWSNRYGHTKPSPDRFLTDLNASVMHPVRAGYAAGYAKKVNTDPASPYIAGRQPEGMRIKSKKPPLGTDYAFAIGLASAQILKNCVYREDPVRGLARFLRDRSATTIFHGKYYYPLTDYLRDVVLMTAMLEVWEPDQADTYLDQARDELAEIACIEARMIDLNEELPDGRRAGEIEQLRIQRIKGQLQRAEERKRANIAQRAARDRARRIQFSEDGRHARMGACTA